MSIENENGVDVDFEIGIADVTSKDQVSPAMGELCHDHSTGKTYQIVKSYREPPMNLSPEARTAYAAYLKQKIDDLPGPVVGFERLKLKVRLELIADMALFLANQDDEIPYDFIDEKFEKLKVDFGFISDLC